MVRAEYSGRVEWYMKLVSDIPRMDMSFNRNNATLDKIYSSKYFESVVLYGSIPVIWLLLTLLLFLVYFCYRCCQRDIEKKRKVPCARTALIILSLLVCIVAAIGIYSDHRMHSSSRKAHHFIQAFSSRFNEIDTFLEAREKEFIDVRINNADMLSTFIAKENAINNEEKTSMMKKIKAYTDTVKKVEKSLRHLQSTNQKLITQTDTYTPIDVYERIRWISSVSFMVGVMALSILLIIGVIVSSKCTLLLYCSFAIFIMVLCYMLSAILVVFVIMTSDYCLKPISYYSFFFNTDYSYYLMCDRPYSKKSRQVLTDLDKNMKGGRNAIMIIKNTFEQSTEYSNVVPSRRQAYSTFTDHAFEISYQQWQSNLTFLLTDCDQLSVDYHQMSYHTCEFFLPFADLLTCVLLLLGLLLTVSTVIASRAWRNFGSTKRMFSHHASVPNENEYLMYNDDYPNQQYSFSRGRQGNPREHMSMQRRNTPPPAYKAMTPASIESAPSADTVPPTPEHHRRYAAMGYGRETDA